VTLKKKKKATKNAAWTPRNVRAKERGALYKSLEAKRKRTKPSTTPGMWTAPSGLGATKLIESPRCSAVSAVPIAPRPNQISCQLVCPAQSRKPCGRSSSARGA